jgi:hypothetical protein
MTLAGMRYSDADSGGNPEPQNEPSIVSMDTSFSWAMRQ